MNAEITIYDYKKQIEERFSLPCDIKDIKKFITPNRDYKITDVEDDFGFLYKIKAYEYDYMSINEIVKMIEKNNDEETTVTKLLYHYELTKCNLEYFIGSFEYIIDKYDIYEGYDSIGNWAKDHNEFYNFIDEKNVDYLYYCFNHNELSYYLRDLYVTYDFGYEIDDFYSLNLREVLNLLDSYDLIFGPHISIYDYLDWEGIAKNLRASAFYIDKFEDKIIVHHG